MAILQERYWIKNGMAVVHRKGGPVMTVDRIERKRKKKLMPDGKIFWHTKGVVCAWIDKEGNRVTKLFHTKDLVKHG